MAQATAPTTVHVWRMIHDGSRQFAGDDILIACTSSDPDEARTRAGWRAMSPAGERGAIYLGEMTFAEYDALRAEHPNPVITLKLSWSAYTRPGLDAIYDAHAERIGQRPAFSVRHGGDHAVVITTAADLPHALKLIAELESLDQAEPPARYSNSGERPTAESGSQ